jgi:LmbE family N-acetylglucosaminyl deacetylase
LEIDAMRFIPAGARVLCFSPHPDDIEFGAGATLAKHRGEFTGRVVVLSDRSRTRGESRNDADQHRAAATLGLPADAVSFVDELGYGIDRFKIRFFATEENRDLLRQLATRAIKEFEPDVIFVPALLETFQDHSALAEEVVRIARGRYIIFGYEVPKHNRHFQPSVFVNIDEAQLQAKIDAVQCFSEFDNRYYFEPDAIRALARMRALQAGYFGLVEAFELYRWAAG